MQKIAIGAVLFAVFVGAVFLYMRHSSVPIANLPPKNDSIVAFGDSLVEGVGATEGNDFVSLLSQRFGRDITNLGRAGDTTESGLLRLDDVLALDPGITIVLLGGNDALRRIPKNETKRNLSGIITELQEQGSVVVLVAVRGGLLSDPYDDMYEELAQAYGVVLVPNVLEGILLRPELTDDQIHPNDEGYALIAERIYSALMPLIK